MRELTVLYDATCALCCDARAWLEREPRHLVMHFVAAGSAEAVRRFPGLDAQDTLRDITVVDEFGSVYRGPKAWVMCLWATRRYRSWAVTLVDPDLWPLAKRLMAWVSRNRAQLRPVGELALRRM